MASIWKKATSPTVKELVKEIIIKKELTLELGRAVRCLQQENVKETGPENGGVLSISKGKTVDNLCSVLEAIFIHGLKNKLTAKVSAVFGNNNDKMPEPEFWSLVGQCSPKDVLAEISSLNEITTDIGKCRAWLRIALNDGLIVSYIDTILQNKSSLQSYYTTEAYMRDGEQPDIMKQLLGGLSVFHFQLVFNSSIIDAWHAKPLMLAGIWSPPSTPQPVMPAIDVAEFFAGDENDTAPISHSKVTPKHSPSSGKSKEVPMLESTENAVSEPDNIDKPAADSSVCYENIKVPSASNTSDQPLMLDSKPDNSLLLGSEAPDRADVPLLGDNAAAVSPSCSIPDFGLEFIDPNDADYLQEEACGNRLDEKSGWSSSFEFCDDISIPKTEMQEGEIDSQSYDSLLQSYNRKVDKSLVVVGTPEISGMMTSMMKEDEADESCQDLSTPEMSPDLDFEIIPKILGNADKETSELMSLLAKICPEQGLDTQQYRCHSCDCPIGFIYGRSRVCFYDGLSYCYDCHENEEFLIPARIIHNWDFKKYPIAKHNKSFLTRVLDEPVIDMKVVNPLIYSVVEDMSQLVTLRTQLSFLRSYIFTCKESIAGELRKKMWPREYLYEHVHLYSISDLLQIPTGTLAQTLQKVITFAKNHVLNCHLCNLKGFICEVCNNSQVIYPFDVVNTYHCERCQTVFHSRCMDSTKPCPKCERRQRHQKMREASFASED